jgi:hypothetical protein
MAVTLPPGWVITPTLEEVPSPNVGTPAAGYFARRTFICTDENGQYVCASGAQEDCEAQAQSMAQCRTQQQPYYGVVP